MRKRGVAAGTCLAWLLSAPLGLAAEGEWGRLTIFTKGGARGAVRLLVKLGYWPEPGPRVIESFDVDAAGRKLGLVPLPGPKARPSSRSVWQAPGQAGRSERVYLWVHVSRDGLDAVVQFLRDCSASNVETSVAGGRSLAAIEPTGQRIGCSFASLTVVRAQPLAGDVCTIPPRQGHPSSMIAFIRHNVAVRMYAYPWIRGKRAIIDAATTAKLVELAQGLDRLLLEAARAPVARAGKPSARAGATSGAPAPEREETP